MQLSDWLSLLGGLALFLYGMQMMSSGLEAAAGERMRLILERLTANRFLGVLVGAGITAVIQSSSATTVMVVGFVSAGMMTLNQAVWIIMGANIGTTVTGLLIALDVGVLAPLFAFVGVAMVVFFHNRRVNHIGQILAGLGVLFIGMGMMSSSMSPLRSSPFVIELMGRFTNPLLGILAGAGITAVIQSSSASVGILQALADSGVITLSGAVFVLFGQNIGTCVTAMLASIGASRNAKRATVLHLMFNVIGTAVFTVVCMTLPLTGWIEGLVPGSPRSQIALMHIIFNIVTTVLLLPFGDGLVALSRRLLPERPEETEGQMRLEYITPAPVGDGGLGASAIYTAQLRNEINRMLRMARENVDLAFRAVCEKDEALLARVEEQEEYVDFLNKEISQQISHMIAYERNEATSAHVSSLFTICGNIERVSDHAMNIAGYTTKLVSREIVFSPDAQRELREMHDLALEGVDALLTPYSGARPRLEDVERIEQRNDDMARAFHDTHLARMRAGICSDEACILFPEMLTDFERMGDHTLNIAQEMMAIAQLR